MAMAEGVKGGLFVRQFCLVCAFGEPETKKNIRKSGASGRGTEQALGEKTQKKKSQKRHADEG